MNKKILATAIALGLGFNVHAGTDEEIALLKKQVEMLSQKISQLEESNKKVVKAQKENSEKVAKTSSSVMDRVKFSADLRDRFEYIDQRGKETRKRNRVRFRVGATMAVNDELDIGFRLASGGDDPTSTNQTLDGAFSTKGIQLDLAYFNWKMTDALTLTGGKMKNPFYKPGKSGILWDGDVNPEGFALGINQGGFDARLVGFSIDERKAADDALLFGGQITKSFKVSDSSKLVAGLGYYDYQNLEGSAPLFDGKARGNTLDSNGNLANDFNTAEAFVEHKTKLSNHPLSVYANFYQNTQADDLDSAYTVGFNYGKVKKPGSWSFGYAYLDVEADAVYALLNDSDFGGGNTDSKGHVLKAGYGLLKNTSLGLTYISSEIGQSAPTTTDYDRLQLDLKVKF